MFILLFINALVIDYMNVFNCLFFVVYYVVDIGLYVGHDPPQLDAKMATANELPVDGPGNTRVSSI